VVVGRPVDRAAAAERQERRLRAVIGADRHRVGDRLRERAERERAGDRAGRQDLDAQGMDLGRTKEAVSRLQIESSDLGRQLQELRFRTEYLTDMLSNLVTRSTATTLAQPTLETGMLQVTNANHTMRFRVPGMGRICD
ncbi:MAG: hypothetical protein WCG22_07350, partial [Lentisphaerota bacterium]